MIVLGVVLIVLGLLLGVHIFYVLGALLAIAGLVLLALGSFGHPVGGRHWYW